MKKAAISLFVIAASGAYVLNQPGGAATNDILDPALAVEPAPASSAPREWSPAAAAAATSPSSAGEPPTAKAVNTGTAAAISTAPLPTLPRLPASPAAAATTSIQPAPPPLPSPPAPPGPAFADVPLPRPRPAHQTPPTRMSAVRLASAFGYADGTYTGPVVDAYYGLIQIQAIVQNGRLAGIKVLRYPSDRRTSVYINRQALPMLRDEAVSAQSAKVDIISGATLTSEAFIRSLGGALRQAGSIT